MLKRLPIFIVALMLATLNIEAVSAKSATLTKSEVQSQIVGKWWNFKGPFSGRVNYGKNGAISLKLSDGSKNKGTWRYKGDRMCTRIDRNFRKGRETCFTWMKVNNRHYKTSLGYEAYR